MAKPYTFPTLYNEAKQVSISSLKKWEFLTPNQFKGGLLTWSTNRKQIGQIRIMVNTQCEKPYIELDYRYGDESRKYKVRLVTVPSNLGKGDIWFFLCPATNKRCRKLYSIGGYFLHREAFEGCMYECQTQSKRWRYWDRTLGAYLRIDDLYQELESKHFKKFYAGKPTKRYLRIIREIERLGSISGNELRR